MLVFYDTSYIEDILKKKMKICEIFHSLPFEDIVVYSIFKEILENDLIRQYDSSTFHIIFLPDSFSEKRREEIFNLFIGVKKFIKNNPLESNRVFLIKTKDEKEQGITTSNARTINWDIHLLGTHFPTDMCSLKPFIYESRKSNIINCAEYCVEFLTENKEIMIVTNDTDMEFSAIISSAGRFTVVNARENIITKAEDTKNYFTFEKAFKGKHRIK